MLFKLTIIGTYRQYEIVWFPYHGSSNQIP